MTSLGICYHKLALAHFFPDFYRIRPAGGPLDGVFVTLDAQARVFMGAKNLEEKLLLLLLTFCGQYGIKEAALKEDFEPFSLSLLSILDL